MGLVKVERVFFKLVVDTRTKLNARRRRVGLCVEVGPSDSLLDDVDVDSDLALRIVVCSETQRGGVGLVQAVILVERNGACVVILEDDFTSLCFIVEGNDRVSVFRLDISTEVGQLAHATGMNRRRGGRKGRLGNSTSRMGHCWAGSSSDRYQSGEEHHLEGPHLVVA